MDNKLKYPKPVSFRHALKTLAMLEDPSLLGLKLIKDRKVIAYLKKRASVRMVADLFHVTPQYVADGLMNHSSWQMPNIQKKGELVIGEERPLFAKGKGAW